MKERLTREDLHQFGQKLIGTIRALLEQEEARNEPKLPVDWLKGRAVRKILDISPGTLQNLRITGKVRFRKILGSYYYNRSDLEQLFNKEQEKG
ncbi:helix-turn-helix domain-containing protein [Flavobacterium alkalisoli]|uniref:Helix-turn-helix domain-containing protein n=1 Tax=Flavobacterium alkalisoli TaxID=2602769 RepID=A0A5B9FUK8_9FLAO|nr:helix-turn-helix domain-containing protein [Flavobacterium alkalisoli]QEE49891.1 helix-turn-helix domain-containing protein [Flavobacterium alkalisoli]